MNPSIFTAPILQDVYPPVNPYRAPPPPPQEAIARKGEALCMFCPHFGYALPGIGPDYSEVTCGDPYGGFSCAKGHFYERRPDDSAEFRELILQAAECPDYEEPK